MRSAKFAQGTSFQVHVAPNFGKYVKELTSSNYLDLGVHLLTASRHDLAHLRAHFHVMPVLCFRVFNCLELFFTSSHQIDGVCESEVIENYAGFYLS